jgi:hypothetical protein
MRAGLGEDVVEVVADADEGEALVEELGDAGGTEEKDAENDAMVLRCGK